MIDKGIRKRFGQIAMQKGFITKDQFVEALAVQVENEQEGKDPLIIGSILRDLGYLTTEQINEVVAVMDKSDLSVCPNCGIEIVQCSNCGGYLR